MKKLIFTLTLLTITSLVIAQDYSKLNLIELKDSMQCKNAEAKVMECSNYLLSKPCVEDLNSTNASQFLSKWMEQTPDYYFSLDDKLYNSFKSDAMLAGRYLASQSKTALTDKPKTYDSGFQLKHIKLFLDYCENPKNNVKPTPMITKLIEANHNGTLREALAGK